MKKKILAKGFVLLLCWQKNISCDKMLSISKRENNSKMYPYAVDFKGTKLFEREEKAFEFMKKLSEY